MPNDLKLMIIEDEELLLDVIVHKLQNNNIKAFAYKSGEEALEHFVKGNENPDLIWLDFHLKGMDGLDFINHLHSELKITEIPIIVVSNEANEEIARDCINAGAIKFLVKAQNRLEDALNQIYKFLETEGVIKENK